MVEQIFFPRMSGPQFPASAIPLNRNIVLRKKQARYFETASNEMCVKVSVCSSYNLPYQST